MKKNTFTVYIEQDEDGVYIGSIPGIRGCYAEGDSVQEMMQNLQEVVRLCLRNQKDTMKHEKFIGIQNLEISYA